MCRQCAGLPARRQDECCSCMGSSNDGAGRGRLPDSSQASMVRIRASSVVGMLAMPFSCSCMHSVKGAGWCSGRPAFTKRAFQP